MAAAFGLFDISPVVMTQIYQICSSIVSYSAMQPSYHTKRFFTT